MKTIFINNENDYATILSELSGLNLTATNSKELIEACKAAEPIMMADMEIEEFKDPMRCRDACYAPTVHIRISKANAHAMDDFFKNYEVDLDDDYHYQDTNEYEWHDTIEECPTDIIDFTFVFWDLKKFDKFIRDVAEKLKELGEDTELDLNFIFPESDGAMEYEDGTREDYDPSLTWKITNGEIKNPNAKIIIFGSKKWQVLYHGYTLLADMPIADWKRLWNVDIVVEM